MFDLDYIHDVDARVASFVSIVTNAAKRGNTVYMLACGSSFHAAKTAPIFFNELAQLPIIPLLPGEFRAQSTQSIRDGDVVIGISQSGETKDLIDVFNFMIRSGKDVKRICILNNTNSTLALEKSDLFIPLFCGPEIAVPATKSFMNQLVLLYILAIRVGEQLHSGKTNAKKPTALIAQHLENLARIPELIDKTLKNTQKETDEIAADLYLKPSMHILATRILGIAKEGALKIREIVLNHTEGFEGSEFKHGPNTILGVNTVFGLDSVSNLLVTFCDALHSTLNSKAGKTLDGMGVQRLFRSVAEFAFQNLPPKYLGETEQALFKSIFAEHNFFASLYSNYPLIFVTCPEETDINLTISQINTHKIRGADVYMIAEDNDLLREAVSLPPGSSTTYRHGYITLPRTDNPLLAIFPITVVLQQLSLKMSQKKMEFLDRLEIDTHGVHPDVPKNVSKSITVD
jgi:glucosamine 6-phosphate synthetase-like amidotransferase/phosphosugar isomerase protein